MIFDFFQKVWLYLQNGIVSNLGYWNYVILLVLAVVEGPIITLAGAAAASAGILKAPLVFAAAALGNMCADMIWYGIGRLGNLNWIAKISRVFKIRPHYLDLLQKGMAEHAYKIIFIAKLTAGLIIPSLIAAGLARVPVRRWFPFLLLAETIWTGSLVTIGYYAAISIRNLKEDFRYIALAGTVIILFLIVFWLRKQIRKSKIYHEWIDEEQIHPD